MRSVAVSLAVAVSLLCAVLAPVAGQPAPSATVAADLVAEAQRHFDRGDFVAGRKLLIDGCAEHRRDHVVYARLLLKLAFFYEQYVGDYRYVKGDINEITGLKLRPDDPSLVAAQELQRRLEAFQAEFSQEDKLLAKVKIYQNDPDVLKDRIAELNELIARRPSYYRMAAAYHYLGESLLALDRYREAYRAFERATALRPAIKFSLPTEQRQVQAYDKWVRTDLALGVWITLGGLLLLGAVLFFVSRPWRHLGRRHALALGCLIAAWWGFFRLAVWLTEGAASREPGNVPQPVEVHTGLGGKLAEPLDILFIYGLVGVCAVFLFAVATARFRRRWTWAAINATVGMVLFTSLLTQFSLRHGNVPFTAAAGHHYAYLRGTFHYATSSDLDPFLLTDPKAHCAFQQSIKNLDEENLKRWFGGYAKVCPNDH